MIASFDVHYFENGRAAAAAVLFSDYEDPEPAAVYTRLFRAGAAEYVPGDFYRRELPFILALMAEIEEPVTEVIVDGYVMLGDRPGLGRHLFESFDGRIPVIGVAKSRFAGVRTAEVLRAGSSRPLYVTSAGIDVEAASGRIRRMHGKHRIPTLLKQADAVARESARTSA